MNKRKLALLEKAFSAEIDKALAGGFGVFQSKSKLAKELVEDGYLQAVSVTLSPPFAVKIEGYILTNLGRITYCESCSDIDG